MHLTRRDLLGRVSSATVTSVALGVASSCSTTQTTKSTGRVAVLSPMSGERAQIGVAVQRAIGLVGATSVDVRVFDTEGTADGARAAVRQASGFGADVIVGPTLSKAILSRR